MHQKMGEKLEVSLAKVPEGTSPANEENQGPGNVSIPQGPTQHPTIKTRTLSLHGLNAWKPFRAQVDAKQKETSIPWRLYEHHFKHRPLNAPSKMDEAQLKRSAGSFRTCAQYKNKVVFLHVFVYDDTTVPTMGTNLSSHFFPLMAKKSENSKSDYQGRMSEQAVWIKEKGEKMGWMKWEPHSQNSSYSQGRLSRGCGVKVSNAISIPDLLRQTLGQLVSLLNMTLHSPSYNIMGSGRYWH